MHDLDHCKYLFFETGCCNSFLSIHTALKGYIFLQSVVVRPASANRRVVLPTRSWIRSPVPGNLKPPGNRAPLADSQNPLCPGPYLCMSFPFHIGPRQGAYG